MVDVPLLTCMFVGAMCASPAGILLGVAIYGMLKRGPERR